MHLLFCGVASWAAWGILLPKQGCKILGYSHVKAWQGYILFLQKMLAFVRTLSKGYILLITHCICELTLK